MAVVATTTDSLYVADLEHLFSSNCPCLLLWIFDLYFRLRAAFISFTSFDLLLANSTASSIQFVSQIFSRKKQWWSLLRKLNYTSDATHEDLEHLFSSNCTCLLTPDLLS